MLWVHWVHKNLRLTSRVAEIGGHLFNVASVADGHVRRGARIDGVVVHAVGALQSERTGRN